MAELKGINDWNNKKDRKEKERAVLKKKDLDDEIADFRNRVSISTDQTVLLDELSSHVAKFTGATACYVGKVDMPIKKSTSDGDFDGSHVIKEGDKDLATGQSIVPEIQWLSATDDHAYMKGQVLKQNEGITYDLFRESKEAYNMPEKDGLPQHLHVKEVVKQPNIKYFEVPRLGSYLAIKLEYASCLFEGSLDAAIDDQLDIKKQEMDF